MAPNISSRKPALAYQLKKSVSALKKNIYQSTSTSVDPYVVLLLIIGLSSPDPVGRYLGVSLQCPVAVPPDQVQIRTEGEEVHYVLIQVRSGRVLQLPIHHTDPQLDRDT